MSADKLYDNLRGYLKVTARVTKKQGNDINVKEKFTVKITGSNTAGSPDYVGSPDIIFKNAKLYVQGTSFAKVVSGNGWLNLPDTLLFPGESSSVSLEFEALKDIPGISDWWQTEKVAKIWIKADLDQDRFFELWNYKEYHTEIDPT